MIKFTIRSNRKNEYLNSDENDFYHIEPLYIVELDENNNLIGRILNTEVSFMARPRYNNLLVENCAADVVKESFNVYPDDGRAFYRIDVNLASVEYAEIKTKLFESKAKFSDKQFQQIIGRVIYPGYQIDFGISGMKFDSESALKIFGYDWKLLQLKLEYPERISDDEKVALCIDFVRKYLI